MAVQLARHLFSVVDYNRMIEAGVLTKDDRVELINGEIVEMSPIGTRHSGCVRKLTHLFTRGLGPGTLVSVQCPIAAGKSSKPQPDITLLVAREDFYGGSDPRPSDVQLLIEVAESSLSFDKNVKVPIYAAGGVPEVWVVDLASGTVAAYSQPQDATYLNQRTYSRGEAITPTAFPNHSFQVDDILP